MAILKVGKVITTPGHLKQATEYSMNEEKTLVNKQGELVRVVEYSVDEEKTNIGERLVDGVNCLPETAAQQMQETKKRFGKTGGRLAYHFFISYEENELSPQLAHEIGVKWAQDYFKDFEVVVSTHCNTDNLHNDIVVNSVSCMDGHKFHNSNRDLLDMRELVDKLCVERNISKIPPIKTNKVEHESFDPVAKWGNRLSHSQLAKADIEESIKASFSLADFYMQMENRGYDVDTSGKHAKIKADDWERPRRLYKLGYTTEILVERIEGERRQPKQIGLTLHPAKQEKQTRHARKYRRPITRFQAMYLRWLYLLGKAKRHAGYTRIDPAEYRKFNQYKKQLQFLADKGITTKQDAKDRLLSIENDIKAYDIEKFKLIGAMRKHKDLFDAYDTFTLLSPLAQHLDTTNTKMLTDALKVIERKGYKGKTERIETMRDSLTLKLNEIRSGIKQLVIDRKMLERILVDSPSVRQNVIVEDRYQGRTVHDRGKEHMNDATVRKSIRNNDRSVGEWENASQKDKRGPSRAR